MVLEQIKNLCKARNITLAQLERDLNFGNGTIRRWNENPPSITKVVQVAEYFAVNLDYLITKTGNQ